MTQKPEQSNETTQKLPTPGQLHRARLDRLEALAGAVTAGTYFLAAKVESAPETGWELILTGTNLKLLTEVSEFIAWKHRDAYGVRYVLVEGHTGKIVKTPFRCGMVIDP